MYPAPDSAESNIENWLFFVDSLFKEEGVGGDKTRDIKFPRGEFKAQVSPLVAWLANKTSLNNRYIKFHFTENGNR